MPATSKSQTDALDFGERARGIASLVILIHLFCVAVTLLGNESASELRNRLSTVLGPYTRLLNIDPEFTAGFHLTHATEYEDDHQVVIDLSAESGSIVFPEHSPGWADLTLGFRSQRWRLLAQRVGILAGDQNDEALAELARAIGEAVFPTSESNQFIFRCRRLRPSELATDTTYSLEDSASYESLYDADVLRSSQGEVRIHKRIQADEAAPVRTNSP